MEIEKIRSYSDEELVAEEHKAAEQLFRLRFQIRSGQQEGVKKLRELKKDVARFKTVARDRVLHGTAVSAAPSKAKKAVKIEAAAAPAKAAAPKAAKKAAKSTAARTTAAKTGKAAK
jgi:large subunit ribosomal protein L29